MKRFFTLFCFLSALSCWMNVTDAQFDGEPGPKIEGPWLWMIASTGQEGGRAAAISGKDYLAVASDGAVTEKRIARNGVKAGALIGNRVWTPGKLAPTGDNNIGETVNAIGLGSGDIEFHVAYGSIALNSPRKQNTTMYVGSDDAVKVWLNGKLVHDNPIDRGAEDYQEAFPVTLKKGKNILLVAVYDWRYAWSGFFGFEKGTAYRLIPLKENPNVKLDISIPMDEQPPMYWLTGGRTPQLQYLRRVSATVETLWESSIPLASKVTALTVDTMGGVLFMTENVDDHFSEIWWVNLTGDPKVENLTSVVGVIQGITVDPKRRELYWTSSSQGRGGSISRLDLSEGGQTTLIQNLDAPGDITVDTEGNKLYWVEGTRIRRSNLNGKNIQDVVTTDNYYRGEFAIAIADRKIYWTQMEANLTNPLFPIFVGRILRANLNGSNIEEVERLGGELFFTILRDIAVDVANKTLYYSQSHGPATHIMGVDLNNLAAEAKIAVYSEAGIGPEQIALGAALADVDGASVVHVERSNRPPMYWIDADVGTLHRLVADEVENLVPTVKNATSLAVDVAGGKLYWTEKISDRTGRIRGANLDGTNVKLVKALTSVAHGLALDTVNGKLYLTNAWGKVQRLNLNGKNFQPNLITGLKSPKHITLDAADGQIYWTEQTSDTTGKIRRATLDGSNVQLVKDLTSSPRGLTLDTANKKLYLTNAYGKVQRLNVDGSNFQPNLITELDAPKEVSVDGVGRKIYWAEQDSIRRADFNGENIEDVVTGLAAPTGIVLGNMPAVARAAPSIANLPPDATVLLANYPNPFNPETWIPYQLAKPAGVTLTIYSVEGALVRTLALGHHPAGLYHNRSRAAYWDGRNEQGEPMASGLYFYTLTAGDFTATRKMLIRK